MMNMTDMTETTGGNNRHDRNHNRIWQKQQVEMTDMTETTTEMIDMTETTTEMIDMTETTMEMTEGGRSMAQSSHHPTKIGKDTQKKANGSNQGGWTKQQQKI